MHAGVAGNVRMLSLGLVSTDLGLAVIAAGSETCRRQSKAQPHELQAQLGDGPAPAYDPGSA